MCDLQSGYKYYYFSRDKHQVGSVQIFNNFTFALALMRHKSDAHSHSFEKDIKAREVPLPR